MPMSIVWRRCDKKSGRRKKMRMARILNDVVSLPKACCSYSYTRSTGFHILLLYIPSTCNINVDFRNFL